MVPCTANNTTPGNINSIGGVVDQEEFITALDTMYRDDRLRDQYAQAGLDVVHMNIYKWENIADQFDSHLTRVLKEETELKVVEV